MNDQHSSKTMWYIVAAIVLALALWYVLSPKMPVGTDQAAMQTTGGSSADIGAELSAMDADSAQLDQASAASATQVKSF